MNDVSCNEDRRVRPMAVSVSHRVQKHRQALRAAGMRPIQLWVPDTRSVGFAAEARRQSLLAAEADRRDVSLDAFLDAAWSDIGGWEV